MASLGGKGFKEERWTDKPSFPFPPRESSLMSKIVCHYRQSKIIKGWDLASLGGKGLRLAKDESRHFHSFSLPFEEVPGGA